jgi:RNA polymerase sigma-70 factor, ECF subfamily
MPPLNPDSVLDLSLLSVERAAVATRAADEEVLVLFDRCWPSLLRYVSSFGLSVTEAEDVVQDAFLALFRHLRLERSRLNLRAWLFQVAHNLALKQRRRIHRRPTEPLDDTVHRHPDPSLNPESLLAERQRRERLAPVVQALPPRDRRCLQLRAEGLRYREIANTLGMSLGGVAKSLSRSIARLVNADRG